MVRRGNEILHEGGLIEDEQVSPIDTFARSIGPEDLKRIQDGGLIVYTERQALLRTEPNHHLESAEPVDRAVKGEQLGLQERRRPTRDRPS